MRIDDEEVWSSLGSYLVKNCESFSSRDLSNQVYSLQNISKLKPIILNFDDLFRKYELEIVKRFNTETIDG